MGKWRSARLPSLQSPARGQQDLGRSVPARGHVLGEGRAGLLLAQLAQGTGQAEVTQLHTALCIQQDVGRLHGTQHSQPFTL